MGERLLQRVLMLQGHLAEVADLIALSYSRSHIGAAQVYTYRHAGEDTYFIRTARERIMPSQIQATALLRISLTRFATTST